MKSKYFLDPLDLGLKIIKNMVEKECQEELMRFFSGSIPVDAQLLSEKLTTMIIFEMRVFYDDLFRQIYEIIYELASSELKEYNNFVKIQKLVFKYFMKITFIYLSLSIIYNQ